MSWNMYHSQSEYFASQAELALRQGDSKSAIEFYKLAAEQEMQALAHLDRGKIRTLGITVVSAASLLFKAGEFVQAKRLVHQWLAIDSLPPFAVEQLDIILQTIWNEEVSQKAGIEFSKGTVLVSVSGGEIITGGAPLDLILRKVDEVRSLFYRTIEMLLDLPLRKRGAPSQEIQQQFRPWLFQAPPGSYQFAVRVQKPTQLPLFTEHAAPEVEQVTQKFLEIIRITTEGSQSQLAETIPDKGYRETFLKLTRNLAPTGKSFNQLSIKPVNDLEVRPIILSPVSREAVNEVLKAEKPPRKTPELTETKLLGVLRGLQLDNDWIEVNISDEEGQKTVRIYETGEIIDDIVGPMVNHRVIVDVAQRSDGRYLFRDIQLEE